MTLAGCVAMDNISDRVDNIKNYLAMINCHNPLHSYAVRFCFGLLCY